MINEQKIINLLGTGRDSDLSSLSSDEEVIGNFPERELENLLNNFDYDFEGMIVAQIEESCEEMGMEIEVDETVMEIEHPQVTGVLDLSISQNISVPQNSNKSTNKWSKFIPNLEKNIFWKSVPFTPPTITIQRATNQLNLTTILNPIDYFTRYFSHNDFENMAIHTNLYASQKKIHKHHYV